MYGEDILDAVDAREFSVWTDDLWDTAADGRADRAVETRPGILASLNSQLSYAGSFVSFEA
jgi:hypothetical protein